MNVNYVEAKLFTLTVVLLNVGSAVSCQCFVVLRMPFAIDL